MSRPSNGTEPRAAGISRLGSIVAVIWLYAVTGAYFWVNWSYFETNLDVFTRYLFGG